MPPVGRKSCTLSRLMSEQVLTVDLGSRSYPIVIGSGLFQNCFDLSAYLPGDRCLVVTNEPVGPLYLE